MEKTLHRTEHLARAKRVWSLRQLTGLSRRDFAKRYGIAPGTLQNWEDVSGNGLSEKGAFRLVKTLKAGGIYCNVEWLLHGVGEPPHIAETLPSTAAPVLNNNAPGKDYESVIVKAELQLFCSHYPEAIYLQVPDNAMQPIYREGDFVAGVRHYDKDIATLIGQDCIVLLDSGDQLLRRIRSSTIPGSYDLLALNSETTITRPYYYDVTLVYAAPVIWSRRLFAPSLLKLSKSQ